MKVKSIVLAFSAAILLAGCNPEEPDKPGKPDIPVTPAKPDDQGGGSSQEGPLDYLKDYLPLKQYVDRSEHPDFRLGAAIEAYDFSTRGTAYKANILSTLSSKKRKKSSS